MSRKKRTFSLKKWQLLGLCVAIVLISLLIFWVVNTQNKSTQDAEEKSSRRASALNTADESAEAVISKGGSVNDAAKVYQDSVNATGDNSTKAGLLFNEAVLYFNNGNLDKALELALQSLEFDNNEGTDRFLAVVYESKGDKVNAIKYYQMAIDNIVTIKDSGNGYSVEYYQNKIKELQG
ncbi:MAG: tetratricopeptide repeat protein [Thiobacillus sp.]